MEATPDFLALGILIHHPDLNLVAPGALTVLGSPDLGNIIDQGVTFLRNGIDGLALDHGPGGILMAEGKAHGVAPVDL